MVESGGLDGANSGVPSPCFRHLYRIGSPGRVSKMPHIPHTCTLWVDRYESRRALFVRHSCPSYFTGRIARLWYTVSQLCTAGRAHSPVPPPPPPHPFLVSWGLASERRFCLPTGRGEGRGRGGTGLCDTTHGEVCPPLHPIPPPGIIVSTGDGQRRQLTRNTRKRREIGREEKAYMDAELNR